MRGPPAADGPGPLATSGRFPGFDGLRAVAILLVLLWHTAVVTRFPAEALGPLRPLVMTGWAGVDLFFALSGFLITALLLREERAHGGTDGGTEPGRIDLWRFYLRRALRILPVFYAVFLLKTYLLSRSSLFSSIRVQELWAAESPLGLIPYATFWGTYFLGYLWPRFGHTMPVHPGEAYDVYWSLYVEEHFYLLWPLFLVLVRSRRSRVQVALAVCLLLGVLRTIAVLRQPGLFVLVQQVSHYRIDSILWGALGALLLDGGQAGGQSKVGLDAGLARLGQLAACLLSSRGRRLALAAVAATCLLLVLTGALSMLPRGTALGLGLGLSLLAVGTTLLLAELVLAPHTRLARMLEWRPLAAIGRLSFAAYLVHLPMMDVGRAIFFAAPRAQHVGNLLLAFVLFTALSLAAALLLHLAVERPFLALKDRYRR